MGRLFGLLVMLAGCLIFVGAAVVEVMWLGFCFGTVIVGFFLLFTMPLLLVSPIAIGFVLGTAVFAKGAMMMRGE